MIDFETLGSGLIIASLSGLTYLAYKHPTAYRTVYWWLAGAAILLFVLAGVWDGSRQFAYVDMMPLLPPDSDHQKFQETIDDGSILNGGVLLLYFGFHTYTFLLTFLPALLGEQDQKHDKRDDERP